MNATPAPNPYVGPRSFTEDQASRFFGREMEVQELAHLVIAERIVLLYSPSGAGKTSLLQAGLIPRLSRERFRVLPLIRVNKEISPDVPPDGPVNRFVLSTLRFLEDGLPETEKLGLDPLKLAGMTIGEYLDRLPRPRAESGSGQPPRYDVLIFDQFEEILTTQPSSIAAQDARFDFFDQLADALDDRSRWAVFSLREDYLAGLDPFRLSIPTRLANRFRLELLQVEEAREAITEPPRAHRNSADEEASSKIAPVMFEDAAVTRLLEDLARPPGQGEDEPPAGDQSDDTLYIEPLHLQLVCHRLWNQLQPLPGTKITADQIKASGDVDTALGGYYNDEVATIAKACAQDEPVAEFARKRHERDIREWFQDQLIIGARGIRGQVPHTEERSGGLDNGIIDRLVDAKLVNRETRLRTPWYELSHDRFISPVRASNARWFDSELNEFQKKARKWERTGRPRAGLLGPGEWLRARSWRRKQPDLLRRYEEQYLEQSGALLTRRMVIPLVLLLLPVAVVLGAIFGSRGEPPVDPLAALAAETDDWANAAQGWLPIERQTDLDLGLLLAAEAVGQQDAHGLPISFDAEYSLLNGMVTQPHLVAPLSYDAPFGPRALTKPVAISNDSRVLATIDSRNRVVFLELPAVSFGRSTGEPASPSANWPPLETGNVTSLGFLQGGGGGAMLLAVGTANGAIELWEVGDGVAPEPREVLLLHEQDPECGGAGIVEGDFGISCGRVTALAFGPDNLLAAGYANGSIGVWEVAGFDDPPGYRNTLYIPPNDRAPGRVNPTTGEVTRLAFGESGILVAQYLDDGLGISRNPLGDQAVILIDPFPSATSVDAWAISPDGELLAVGDDEGIYVRQVEDIELVVPFGMRRAGTEPVSGLAFNPADPATLFSSHENGQIIQWGVGTVENLRLEGQATVSGITGTGINVLLFSPDGRRLISRDAGSALTVWSPFGVPPIGQSPNSMVPSRPACVENLSFDGNTLHAEATGESTSEWHLQDLYATPLPTSLAEPSGTPATADPTRAISLLPQASPTGAGSATPGAAGPLPAVSRGPVRALPQCANGSILTRSELQSQQFLPEASATGYVIGVLGDEGDVLVTVDDGGRVVLWQQGVAGWEEIDTLRDDWTSEIRSVTRNADQDLVAVGTADGVIRLWAVDGDDLRLLGRLPGHSGSVTSMVFHPQRDYLATGDANGMVIVWNLDPKEWVSLACDRAGRPLTQTEIETYLRRAPGDMETVCEAHLRGSSSNDEEVDLIQEEATP